jgi:hypothetical protein
VGRFRPHLCRRVILSKAKNLSERPFTCPERPSTSVLRTYAQDEGKRKVQGDTSCVPISCLVVYGRFFLSEQLYG